MTTLYVAKDGSDAADGLSWANAKLTIDGAIAAAAHYDVVKIASGVYDRFEVLSTKQYMQFLGQGLVIIDGGGEPCIYHDNGHSYLCVLEDMILRNAGADFLLKTDYQRYQGWDMRRIEFQGGGISSGAKIYGYSSSQGTRFQDCVIHNCLEGVQLTYDGTYASPAFDNVTIAKNTRGVYCNSSSHTPTFAACIFYENSEYHVNGHIINRSSDWNLFYPLDSEQTYDGKSDLPSIQADTPPAEANSVTADPQFSDPDNDVFSLTLTSPYGASLPGGNHIGGVPPCLVLSPNSNQATYDAPADSSGLTQVGGIWELNTSPSGTYRSAVLDFGHDRTIKRVCLNGFSITDPSHVVDYSTADVDPRQWTFRYRTQTHAEGAFTDNGGAAPPAWQEANLHSFLNVVARYLQFELILRDDGA